MSIPNKQLFSHGDRITQTDLNTLEDNFQTWIENHHHVNRNIPILTIVSNSKLEEIIASDTFMFNFTNNIVNQSVSFSTLPCDILILTLKKISDAYNKSVLLGKENFALKNILQSAGDYSIIESDSNRDTYKFVYKTPILTEDDQMTLTIEVPDLIKLGQDNQEFFYSGNFMYQKPQTIVANKFAINSYVYTENTTYGNVLEIIIDVLENASIGIPALPISAAAIRSISGSSALQHVQNASLHPQVFASEAKLAEIPKFNLFATPNWQKDYDLVNDGRMLISSNDKMLSLNIIKNEQLTRPVDPALSPLDVIFCGDSKDISWINDSYFSGELRDDVTLLKKELKEGFNYEVETNEAGSQSQSSVFTTSIPSRVEDFEPSTMFNMNSSESRAIRMMKNVKMSTTDGNSFKRIPLSIKLIPNYHSGSYLYSPSYIKLQKTSGTLFSNYAGSPTYSSSVTNFEYNITKGLELEKILFLGSPYEPFNRGAEHLYKQQIVKDYANENADENGYYVREKTMAEIRSKEQRLA